MKSILIFFDILFYFQNYIFSIIFVGILSLTFYTIFTNRECVYSLVFFLVSHLGLGSQAVSAYIYIFQIDSIFPESAKQRLFGILALSKTSVLSASWAAAWTNLHRLGGGVGVFDVTYVWSYAFAILQECFFPR